MIYQLSRAALPDRPGAFRLWLALIVVVHHLVGYEFGKVAVLVFFSLSGFWAVRVWDARYSRTRAPIVTFLVSRWWRIAPMLVLATILSAAVLAMCSPQRLAAALENPVHLAVSSLFAIGYAALPERLVPAAWSLDLEMQFYLLVPALMLAVRRFASVSFAVVAVGMMGLCYALPTPGWWGTTLPLFLLGMCAARCRWHASRKLAVGGAAIAVAAVVLSIVSPWHALLIDPGAPLSDMFGHGLALFLLPAALASVSGTDRAGSAGEVARDHAFGDLSYIVYLLHGPLLFLVQYGPVTGQGRPWAAGAVLVAVLPLLSWLAWKHVDRPVNRLRSGWVAARLQNSETKNSISTMPTTVAATHCAAT